MILLFSFFLSRRGSNLKFVTKPDETTLSTSLLVSLYCVYIPFAVFGRNPDTNQTVYSLLQFTEYKQGISRIEEHSCVSRATFNNPLSTPVLIHSFTRVCEVLTMTIVCSLPLLFIV